MEPKHIVIGIAIIAGAITLVILGMIGIYQFYPESIGLEPNENKDTTQIEYISLDTVPLVPTVEITEQRILELQKGILEKRELLNQKDSLFQLSLALTDSIRLIESANKKYLDSIGRISGISKRWKDSTNTLYDSLNSLYSELKRSIEKLERNELLLEDQEEFIARKQDTLEKQNFITYAKIYNSANPVEVAKILELIDENDASQILKAMSKKQAAKVLEAMEPNRAAAIMLLGANE